ncbi:Mitochondrial Rho GTPase 2 [Zancudomyces culisetae]|uniref:Mitochondrial Rho GTPase 2 n=1 Tax=Zancudomyces culisetae TaxID=1213189 RepID=A0A1R1PQN9_ZANCU|nr:Mitochondrial Rho GTPase 2 [Zancudomyces culisetae]|eukprot:OMH83269.1 Mitochondrial Rho GTPase 2 [Zancudomyces culisetae]
MSKNDNNKEKVASKEVDSSDTKENTTASHEKTDSFQSPTETSTDILFAADGSDISEKLMLALTEIFSRYDKDGDKALNPVELDNFAIFTNGTSFTDEEINEIKLNLDTDDSGNLTLAGFIELYALQTMAGDCDETWKDLKTHGYNEKLELVDQSK